MPANYMPDSLQPDVLSLSASGHASIDEDKVHDGWDTRLVKRIGLVLGGAKEFSVCSDSNPGYNFVPMWCKSVDLWIDELVCMA